MLSPSPTPSPLLSTSAPLNASLGPSCRNEALAKIEVGVQAVIFFLAIVGNSLVLFFLLCSPSSRARPLQHAGRSRGRMQWFLAHLSLADLLVALFNVLPQLLLDVTVRFAVPSDLLCRFVKFCQVAVLYGATYILVMCAVDRFFAIVHPLSAHRFTRRRLCVMVAVPWGLALLCASPQAVMFSFVAGENDCWTMWSDRALFIYTHAFFVAIFLIPLCILIACYSAICIVVCRSMRAPRAQQRQLSCSTNGGLPGGSLRNGGPRRALMNEARLRTISMTFTVCVAYVICWAPFFFSHLWWAHNPTADPCLFGSAQIVCLLLASLNSCCNPWIYGLFAAHKRLCRRGRVLRRDTIYLPPWSGASSTGRAGPPTPVRCRSQIHGSYCRDNL
nr:oxytocin/vasopressin-like peptide receptor [Stylochoplana pusilla]